MSENKKKKGWIWGVAILALIVLITIPVGIFRFYYGKVNYQELESEYAIGTEEAEMGELVEETDSAEPDSDEEEIEKLNTYLEENRKESDEPLISDENVYHILLLGTDARTKDQRGRSDSMIIVSVNKETRKIVMTSIMRDTYVHIPGVGNNRINAAYAYGGTELLLDTIEENFGIHVDEYVKVNFFGFMDVVDAVGGVEMDISAAEIRVMNGYIHELNTLKNLDPETDKLSEDQAGRRLLNGKQALAYARVRYVGNADFQRTQRQRDILMAVMEKSKSMSLVEVADLAGIILPQVTTNLSEGDVLSLMMKLADYQKYKAVSARMPVDGSYQSLRIRGMAVLGVDFEANKAYWKDLVYGK